jgi:hypothetical protein
MHYSICERRGRVVFPSFLAERIYMEPVVNGRVPLRFERWQTAVTNMLRGIPRPALAYLMVDQVVCEPGQTSRRPGVHCDGYWVAQPQAHKAAPRHAELPKREREGHKSISRHLVSPDEDGGKDVHTSEGGGHGSALLIEPMNWQSGGSWRNAEEIREYERTHPKTLPEPREPRRIIRQKPKDLSWENAKFMLPEAVLLTSDVQGCQAFTGYCAGGIHAGGDARDVRVDHMERVLFEAGYCYANTTGTLHESLPVATRCLRTVIRLNVPGWAPETN